MGVHDHTSIEPLGRITASFGRNVSPKVLIDKTVGTAETEAWRQKPVGS
jgi:hypothetical protein